MEEDQTAMEAGLYSSVTRRGRSHYCNLSLPTCSTCRQTVEKATSGLAITHLPQAIEKDLSELAFACLLPGTRKSPARAGPHVPYARHQKSPSLGPYILRPWPPASLSIVHHWGSRDPKSYTTFVPCPHWGRPKCSRAAPGAGSCG